MTSNLIAAVDVNRPIRTIYNQWTQFESLPQFMEGVERVDQLDDKEFIESRPVESGSWRGDVQRS